MTKIRAELRKKGDPSDIRVFPDMITATRMLMSMPQDDRNHFEVWDIDESDGYACMLFDGCTQDLRDFVDVFNR